MINLTDMAQQNQSKNMASLLEEKSNIIQALVLVEKKIRLLRRKELVNSGSQFEDSDIQVDSDYNSGDDEEDYVCNLRKRKTKNSKVVKRKDKDTRNIVNNFSSKRAKVARAAKKSPRLDIPFQNIDNKFEDFEDSDCECFFCCQECQECRECQECQESQEHTTNKRHIDAFEYFDPEDISDRFCQCISCITEKNKVLKNENKWLNGHLEEVTQLTVNW